MRRITEPLLSLALAAAGLTASTAMANQPITYSVPIATNSDCASALPFCNTIHFQAAAASGANCGYLWFQFEVAQEQLVVLSFAGCGAAAVIPAAQAAENGCSCIGLPAQYGSSYQNSLLPGVYFVVFRCGTTPPNPVSATITVQAGLGCPTDDCGCLPPPTLEPGKPYIVTAWTKKETVPWGTIDQGALVGARPFIKVQVPAGNSQGAIQCFPNIERPVVEGWQQIECPFTAGASLRIELGSESGNAYFDDVRVMPDDGSMKCFVYDPYSLRFVAELDERHFATFYEYDGEGKLVRVKKETERGIMTIQESRSQAARQNP